MSIEPLASAFLPTLALVGLLGFRHGFDADHIAVVDGMTRARQLHHSYWTARLVGAQFALGHSAAILAASLLLYGHSVVLPQWLDGLGVAISSCFLLLIAVTNLAHALRSPGGAARPVGPAAALSRLTGQRLHPCLVGVAFAMSLDSLAQAAFFTTSGASAGIGGVALLAATFGLGMLVADAANGALLGWFASRSDRLARHASRFSSGFIALVALATAGTVMLREVEAGFAAAWERMGVWTGVGLFLVTVLVYSARIAMQKARAQAAAPAR